MFANLNQILSSRFSRFASRLFQLPVRTIRRSAAALARAKSFFSLEQLDKRLLPAFLGVASWNM
jgi:hypothetical protein